MIIHVIIWIIGLMLVGYGFYMMIKEEKNKKHSH